jgi:hypothetical protein
MQPKIQEVYFPIEDINSDDFTPHILCNESGEYIQNLERQKLITFTPEEFEQFKREFGKELLELAADNATTEEIYEDACKDHTPYRGVCCSCNSYYNHKELVGSIINKESILNTLDDYLLNNKI